FYAQLHECHSALATEHEVPHPLLPEGFWNPSSSLVQGRPHPLQRPQRSFIDSFRDHDDDSPAVLIEPFAAFKIVNPLVAVKCMVTSVVLDDQLVLGVTEVNSQAPPAACNADDEVDLGFRQSSENHEQAYPSLHWRVDARTYERGGPAGALRVATLKRFSGGYELLRVEVVCFDQAVTGKDQ